MSLCHIFSFEVSFDSLIDSGLSQDGFANTLGASRCIQLHSVAFNGGQVFETSGPNPPSSI